MERTEVWHWNAVQTSATTSKAFQSYQTIIKYVYKSLKVSEQIQVPMMPREKELQ